MTAVSLLLLVCTSGRIHRCCTAHAADSSRLSTAQLLLSLFNSVLQSSRNPGTQRMNVLNEISIMKEVEDHPNAVTLREVYETPHTYYLVMDCCDGGELFEHITKSKVRLQPRSGSSM